MPFIMGTPDEPFLIIYCLALTKHIYKKIKSKYLNKYTIIIHNNTPIIIPIKKPIKKYLIRGIYKYPLNRHITGHFEKVSLKDI